MCDSSMAGCIFDALKIASLLKVQLRTCSSSEDSLQQNLVLRQAGWPGLLCHAVGRSATSGVLPDSSRTERKALRPAAGPTVPMPMRCMRASTAALCATMPTPCQAAHCTALQTSPADKRHPCEPQVWPANERCAACL